jgi:succinate dehydrogenase/fumarate reductase-like Fe-S protein
MLFFTANIFKILVENTIINALLYINELMCNWSLVTVNDIRVFIAIAIYIGLECKTKIKDYWNKPIRHEPMWRMPLFRFE